MSNWERNGNGLKKLELLCSSAECSENDSRNEESECEEDDQRDKDTRRLLLSEQSNERVAEVNQRDTPTVRAPLLDPIIACIDEATLSEGQSVDAVDDNDDTETLRRQNARLREALGRLQARAREAAVVGPG